ncbi:MAG: bacterial transcriptional activator domain-containing protein, partial [Candidatus Kapaibacterium sp.]
LETEITFRGMEGMLAASIGLPLDHVEQIFRKLTDELSEHMHGIGHESTVLYEMIANWLCTIGNIRGNPDWGENLSRILCGKEMPEYQILEAGILSDNQEKIERGIELRYAPEVLRSLATHSLGNNQTLSDELVSRLSSFLQASSSGQIAMLHLNAAALLLEKIGEPIPDEIRTALVQALERGLQWCKEKGLVGVAEQLLERSRVCWSPSTIKGWKEQFRQRRADALQLWGIHKQSSVSTKLSFVTMMDEISICYADLPPQPIPGTRVQQTLGLLVANQQMKHSLTLETFRELATGIEADPSGSANYLRVIVSRIRTILGKDSIISDGKNPPYLNTCVVQVDLLEASEELDRCVEAIRTLRPRRAKQEVLKALQRSGGKALYPTLEGEFFDAARQDFEIRIRKAVLSTAHLLSQEKDSEEAADLLRTATLLMPEDEEVAEELISLLRSLERHAEAFSMSRQLLR